MNIRNKALDAQNGSTLVIGGGPTGLATAIMLAMRGYKDITVVEKNPSPDFFQPDKSFLYQIGGRGQKFTDFAGVTGRLKEVSVPATSDGPLPLTRWFPDGSHKSISIPSFTSADKVIPYWVPRPVFLRLLYEHIQEKHSDSVRLMYGNSVGDIERAADQVHVSVTDNSSGSVVSYKPRLVIGCDGLKSVVRKTLSSWVQDDQQLGAEKENPFAMTEIHSDSGGLRYKILFIPPGFKLDSDTPSVAQQIYVVHSALKGRDAARLGLLPVKDPLAPRTANLITLPDHKVWSFQKVEDQIQFLRDSFPQLMPIMPQQEIERFAGSKGSCFPYPQYASAAQYITCNTAFLIIGDSLHAFPPDLGQGVNSSLEDVMALKEALDANEDELTTALPAFESEGVPEAKALIRLQKISAPYQYSQYPLRKALYDLNVLLRIVLNKLAPNIFSPHSAFLVIGSKLKYSEIVSTANRTTQRIVVSALVIFAVVLFALIK